MNSLNSSIITDILEATGEACVFTQRGEDSVEKIIDVSPVFAEKFKTDPSSFKDVPFDRVFQELPFEPENDNFHWEEKTDRRYIFTFGKSAYVLSLSINVLPNNKDYTIYTLDNIEESEESDLSDIPICHIATGIRNLQQLDTPEDIFEYISDISMVLVPESIVIALEFIDENRQLYVHTFNESTPSAMPTVKKLLGFNPIHHSFAFQSKFSKVFQTPGVHRYAGSFADFAKDTIPEKIANVFEKKFGIKSIFLTPLIGTKKTVGILVFLHRLQEIRRIKFLKTFVSLSSIILERSLIQSRCLETESKSRRVIDSSPIGYISLGKDLHINDVNESLARMTGFKKTFFIGKRPEEFFDSEPRRETKRSLAKLPFEESQVMEISLLHNSGQAIPVMLHTTPIFDSLGNINESILFITDLRPLKNAREEINKSLKRQRLLYVVSGIYNMSGDFLTQTKVALDVLGDHLNIDYGCIYIQNENREFSAVIEIGQPRFRPTERTIPTPNLIPLLNILKTEGTINVNLIHPLILQPLHINTSLQTMISPLMKQEEFFGLLLFNKKNSAPWETEDRELVSTTTSIIANAFEKSRAHERLLTVSAHYQLAVKSSQAGFWQMNLVDNKLILSDEWKEMLGYKTGDFANINGMELLKEVTPERDVERYKSQLQKLSNSQENENEFEFEAKHVHKTKGEMWFLVRGVIKRNAGKRPVEIIGFTFNIQEIKEAQYRLREELNRSEVVAAVAQQVLTPDPPLKTIISDIQNLLHNTTGAAYQFFIQSNSPENNNPFDAYINYINGKNTGDLSGSPVAEIGKNILAGMKAKGVKSFYINDSGSLRSTYGNDKNINYVFNILIAPVVAKGELLGLLGLANRNGGFDDEMLFFVSRVANILAFALLRTRIEAYLKKARDDAENSNKAKSEFLANMSHELRTPLNSVLGFASLLIDHLNDARLTGFARSIQKSGQALLEIINDILDLSRLESGHIRLNERPTELDSILLEIENMFSLDVKKKNLTYTTNIERTSPPVFIDTSRLRQILINLISNSVKYTKEGGIKVALRSLPEVDDMIDFEIKIEDTGPGIPQHLINNMQEAFQTALDVNRSSSGTGLGLAITSRLIQVMNADMNVDSRSGKGTSITIEFSKVRVVPPEMRESVYTDKTPAEIAEIGYSQKLVHIIDDREESRYVLRKMLEKKGLSVIESRDGKEALEKITKTPPDMLFVDNHMPFMDGPTLAKLLNKNRKTASIPFILLTASEMDDSFTEMLESHLIGDHIVKPLSEYELNKILKKYFGAESEVLQSFEVEEIPTFAGTVPEKKAAISEEQLSPGAELNTNPGDDPLMNFLRTSMDARVKKIKQRMILSEVRKLADSFIRIGEKENLEFIVSYGSLLREAADMFDLEKINDLLSNYEIMILNDEP